ncbi:MAG: glucose sorbosone dehydrogenase [Planctomycetaceae bacterium]|jgi:glucose/arabinose dehydrogenase|nr:glucose sorbosone dehydrogenase [Planctomycetaceae bacterium]MBT6483779.1 glucose sorbosone dehydrogenase [Planctomycetaceae bacterium]MBT6498187.1 glucose sorbosone dehydrogenase [Planctomycetaceae bacterium]
MKRTTSLTALIAGLCCLLSATVASAQVDKRPLPIGVRPAFANMKWTGWSPVSDSGKVTDIRPIVLTHAGDGSNRLFVAAQRGVIHVFPNKKGVKQTKIFLDVSKQVVYKDKQNEEGLLGFAFHPKYKENGHFFLYYTTTDAPLTSVVTRFTVSKTDPNRADPDSELEIMRVKQPYWNHNGGTIVFGPDGYLYIALGDGGAGKDPHGNGQNLKTLLGSILRIDVDHQHGDRNYSIPKDNPFVGKGDAARPEIYAYGLRNVWRMAFDNKTGTLWAGEVGQDLWEEIDLIVKGGNYGWNLREAKHKFLNGSGPRKDLIEPIWEYHHEVGKSITGGSVYRGKKLPQLTGHYIYADYVSSKIWALKYDEAKKKVVANRPLQTAGNKLPILSFGEDQNGEIYFMLPTTTGRGLFTFAKQSK